MMKEVVVTCWKYITWQLFANTKIRWEIPFDLWQSGKILQGEKGWTLMQLCKKIYIIIVVVVVVEERVWQCGWRCFSNNFSCQNAYQWFFLFFKNYFWYQHIKTIQNIQTILNFNKKIQIFWKRSRNRISKHTFVVVSVGGGGCCCYLPLNGYFYWYLMQHKISVFKMIFYYFKINNIYKEISLVFLFLSLLFLSNN
jgi:hypothetical protein